MSNPYLVEFEKLSKAIGNRPDYVQGGGGNTSAKFAPDRMAVKASGFRINQITETEGYVVIDYPKLSQYYHQVDLNKQIDWEKDSKDFTASVIIREPGAPELRPSVEAGFHSLLKTYVVHTHSVYANLITCGLGQKAIKEILPDMPSLWFPYCDPGFRLSVEIARQLTDDIRVIFLENHGIIVTADDAEECVQLHETINNRIKAYFNITSSYKKPSIQEIGEQTYRSTTGFELNDLAIISNYILYPDQLVYLNTGLDKMSLDHGHLIYHTNQKEALVMEETLAGFLFVVQTLKSKNIPVHCMSEQAIHFIANWESEKYRKSLNK